MAFASFIGRVFFASIFILSAWQEFNDYGTDGGVAAKSLAPKLHVFSKHVAAHTGFEIPEVEVLNPSTCASCLAYLISLGLFYDPQISFTDQGCSCCCYRHERCWKPSFHLRHFVIVCRFNDYGTDGGVAAKSLAPKLHVFSKHVAAHTGFEIPEVEIKAAVAAAIGMKGVGSLLFIFGSSLGAYLLLLHQAIFIPILYDFYNYDPNTKEFNQLFIKFTQSLALFGALLFFVGMKNSIPRRQLKKKTHKKQL
ncbi:hypothetical protein LINPERPRIM_LOCUS17077 [Linum perenne]